MDLPPAEWTAYRARLRDERAAGWLTAAQLDVLEAIANLNAAGDWEPTVAKIAVYACVSVRTVQRARAVAQERGLLIVERRHDGRWQTANRYGLALPTAPVTLKPAKPKGCQSGRARDKKKEEKRLTRVVVASESLAAIARRRMAVLGLGR